MTRNAYSLRLSLIRDKSRCKWQKQGKIVPAILLLMAVWVNAPQTLAQTAGTGALTGRVTDPFGAVIPDTQIKVINEATGETRTVISQDYGAYVIALLPPGSYRIEASKSGFKLTTSAGVRINVTETRTLGITLEVGTVEEQVTVEAAVTLVQTETSTLGRAADERVVANLPLVTRNYTQILPLSPGIIANVTNATEVGRGSGGLSNTGFASPGASGVHAHGARSSENNFQMNGVEINDLQNTDTFSGGVAIPNPDTIQEFKVQTGQYDASFGRNSGANVNVVTKGGSNEFHGSLFHFFRNEALNANEFFFNRSGQPKPILRQNQFGGALGGPIKKEKLLFFGSYQGTRQINGAAASGRSKCRDAAFSPPLTDDRSPVALGRLFAGQRGSFQNQLGGVGPAIKADGSNIHPVALELLQMKLPDGRFLIPTPQVIDPTQPFNRQGFSAFSEPCTFDEDQFMVNLNFLHTAKSTLVERFFYSGADQNVSLPPGNVGPGRGNVPGFPLVTKDQYINFTLSHTYVFSTRLLNQVHLGFHRTDVNQQQLAAFKWSDLGIAAVPQTDALPLISITGTYQLGGVFPLRFGQNTFTIQDSVSYIRGRQTLRFGGALVRAHNNFNQFNLPSTLIFLSFADFLLGLDGRSNGTPFSNVFGSVDAVGLMDRTYRLWDGSAYIQDDIKVTPRFTLNLGLRYERMAPISEESGRGSNFYTSLANPNPPPEGTLEGYVVNSNFKGTLPRGVAQLDDNYGINGDGQNKLAPRVGFAWQVFPRSSRLVLRSGYGVYYSRLTGVSLINTILNPPFSLLRSSVGVGNAGATLGNPFPQPIPGLSDFPQFPAYSPTTARSVSSLAEDFQPAVTQQYSLNLQTDFARDFLFEVGYVGARGTKLTRLRSVNQALLASPANPIRGITTNTVANISQRVPFLGWGPTGISQSESGGASWYNGLEVSLTKRFSKGLQFLASYTWSKALDTDLGLNLRGTIGDQNNPRQRWGRSAFNRDHRFVVSYLYELPSLKDHGSLVGNLLGGWAVSGVTTFQSGQALTLISSNNSNVFGITSDRAQIASGCTHSDLVTPGSVNQNVNNYFNRACFTAWPVIGDDGVGTGFGNSGVGIVNGPGQQNFDIAIIKRKSLGWPTENSNLEFRTEFFNAFNTPQFAIPDTNFSSPTFGQITSTSVNPRVIQFALKFNF